MTAGPVRRPRDDAPEEVRQPCSYCQEPPTGRTGHEGLAVNVKRVPETLRTYSCFTCFFCRTRWARRRLNAREFQWHRIAE